MHITTMNTSLARRLLQLSLPISIALILLALLFLSFALTVPGGAAAATLYVDGAAGSDDPACGTDSAPCKTISYTLNTRAGQGDTLLLAAGLYAENLTVADITTTLRGGYTISGTQWLPGTGETVINGGSADRTFIIHGGTVILEDLTISGGAADPIECWGDTIWATNAQVTVRNTVIKDSMGGCTGIEANQDFGPVHLTMQNSTVANLGANGALHVWGENASATIQDAMFYNNTSGDLGAIFIDFNATAAITNTHIFSNTARTGAGIAVVDGAYAVVRNSAVYSNTAFGGGGGGVRVEGGQLEIFNSSVMNNNAPNGQSGAIDVHSNGTATLTDSIISGNTTRDHGGAASVNPGSVLNLTNALITGNATTSGNANVFAIFDGKINITNSTIADNNPSAAQAVIVFTSGSFTMTNSIMWNNALNLQGDPPCPSCFNVTYSIMQGGYTGTGNIDMDPLFVGANDYRLQAGSPAIDKGTDSGAPDHDLNQVPRPQDGDDDGTATTDMGAYEFVWYKIFLPMILTDFTP